MCKLVPSDKDGFQFAAVNFCFGKGQHSLQRFDLVPADVIQLQEIQGKLGPSPHPQRQRHLAGKSLGLPAKRRVRAAFIPAGDPQHGCVFSLGSRSVRQDTGVRFSSLLLVLAWVGLGLCELGLWVMIKLISNNMCGYGEKLLSVSKKTHILTYGLKNTASRVMFWAVLDFAAMLQCTLLLYLWSRVGQTAFLVLKKWFCWAITRLD